MPRTRANGAGGSPTPPEPGEEALQAATTTLTQRQLEILSHVARGRTNRQIGEALGISELTVRNHMSTIGQRLSSTDRTHAVVLAIGQGLIAVPVEPESSPPALTARVAPATD